MLEKFKYFIPFIPLLSRLVMAIKFRKLMPELLEEKEMDRDGHRSIILPLSSFCFTGLLAIILLDRSEIIKIDINILIYFLCLSFISYMWSLNYQKYKFRRWEDQLATSLEEIGSLSLILSIVFSLLTFVNKTFAINFLIIYACAVWLLNHSIHLKCEYDYFKNKL